MSIRRRGKNTWEVLIELGPDPQTGERRRRFFAVKGTKRDAELAETAAKHERDTGIDLNPEKMSVAAFLHRWLDDYAQHQVSPATFREYRRTLERHVIPALGALPLASLRPAHLQSLYGHALSDRGRLDGKEGGLSARSVLHLHRVLRQALQNAVRWQLLSRNPADAVTPPRPPRTEMQVLAPEEVQHLLRTAEDHPLNGLLYVAVATGARLGELLALRWSNVDWTAATLHITRTAQRLPGKGILYGPPKTHRSARPIALSPDTVEVLREHRVRQAELRLALGPGYVDQNLLFARPDGMPLPGDAVYRAFQGLLTKAGVRRIRFHDLRHTAATLLLKAGVHPKIVSERLGHASVTITLDTYSHVLPDMQRDAAGVLDKVLRTGTRGG